MRRATCYLSVEERIVMFTFYMHYVAWVWALWETRLSVSKWALCDTKAGYEHVIGG
jgi:hypothetical protein